MRLKNYKDGLLKRLEDQRYAAEYLTWVIEEKDGAAFLIALNDVVAAAGGCRAKTRRLWKNRR